jgi:hypothetical protein
MRKADRQLKKWIDMTERLLSRHPSTNSGDNEEQQALKELFDVRKSSIRFLNYFFFRIFIYCIYNIEYE